MNYFQWLWRPGLSLNRGGVHMEGNGAGCGSSLQLLLPPQKAEIVTAPGLTAWISCEPGSAQRTQWSIVGSQWGRIWMVYDECFSGVQTVSASEPSPPCFPWHLPRAHALPYSPPPSSIALVCSAGPTDLNCKCSLNKQNLLDTTFFIY